MRTYPSAALVLSALLASAPAVAGLHVPAGGRFELGGGGLSLAAQDLQVDGTFVLGGGTALGVASFRLGGQADFGSGLFELSGDWDNHGAFTAGDGRVRFTDGPAESALLGSTTFANASFVSANGKRYRFESGSTQVVAAGLEILGDGAPIQIDVTQPGATALLNLLPSGTQSIANVGVSDVHATGQWLAPDQTNQGGRGNADGWFGGGGPVVVPAVPAPVSSPLGLGLFALALLALALRALRRHSASGVSP